MKYILILSVFIATNAWSQKDTAKVLSEKNGAVYYSGVVDVDTTFTKDQLFLKARKWFAGNYTSGKDVIQVEDKEAGQIIGKGLLKTTYLDYNIYVWHTVEILVKQGKYKYIITNFEGNKVFPSLTLGVFSHPERIEPFEISNSYNARSYRRDYKKYLTALNERINSIIKSLESKMNLKDDF